MKVTVTLELRFDVLPDGSVWTLSNFHRDLRNRYLEVYESVEIVARANLVKEVSPSARRVDESPKVTFRPLPFYIGPIGYLKKWNEIKSELMKIESEAEAVILRVGSPLADIIQPILVKNAHPYALEVVGDPYDTFAPGSLKSIFRPLYRWLFCKKLRDQAVHASAVSYVTSVRLPIRYPTSPGVLQVYASSIELNHTHMVPSGRDFSQIGKFRLISIGALEDWRKGPDIALKAIKGLKRRGIDLDLTWVGDGRIRSEVENLARDLGVKDLIKFKGHLASGEEVFKTLDEADIFILPTRGEGLPRAMIEAMARGLVCVATDVGGIPELVSQEFLHPADDSTQMINILERLMLNKEEMNKASQVNLLKAQNYLSDKIQEQRIKMYKYLKGKTDEWKKNRSIR